jgi:ATP-dependent DNA helicase RecG
MDVRTLQLSSSTPKIPTQFIPKLQKLNIHTVYDLLTHKPRKYEDFSRYTLIEYLSEFPEEAPISLRATCVKRTLRRIPRRKLWLIEATFEDSSGDITLTWINQRYRYEQLIEGELYSISGYVKHIGSKISITQPETERVQAGKPTLHTGRLLPLYPATSGITSRFFRAYIYKYQSYIQSIQEFLPQDIITLYNLIGASEMLHNIHFPKNEEDIRLGLERWYFNELFRVNIYLLQQRIAFQSQRAHSIPTQTQLIKKFLSTLPYSLTQAQRKSTWEILQDMTKPSPMNRLLQGDVGSGKTLVATIATLNTIANKKQVAFMAPTEILAKQHFESLREQLQPFDASIQLGLYTSSEQLITTDLELGGYTNLSTKSLLKLLTQGKIDCLVGTHSLISDKVIFKDIGLAIVDEQHRFGVNQRSKLQKDLTSIPDGTIKTIPHFLSMSATPIPRTLALSIYGNLDVSTLDELPAGRKEIQTKVVTPSNRPLMYSFIDKHLEAGRQAYVVCPRIEEDDESDLKAVDQVARTLQKGVFKHRRVSKLHGKLKPEEKEKIMKDFQSGSIDILVATSVIEVGVNVPNATIMLIEGAERFGLAQLHQFRGRVGRGKHASFCFLCETKEDSEITNERLLALEKAKSGFDLAEIDLQLRGPGQFAGSIQSGLPDVSMEAMSHPKLISLSRQAAREIISKDPSLASFPSIRKEILHFTHHVHFE